MKLSVFLAIKTIISLVFGIAMAVIPTQMMPIYDVTLDPAGVYMTRLLGAMLIGIGLICWMNRNAGFSALRGTLLALFVGDTIGFLVTLWGQLDGVVNALGWVNVIIYLLLALGMGYYSFVKQND